MRTFDYRQRYEHILKSDIVDLVMQIHEYKGQQILFVKAREDTLAQLQEVVKFRVQRSPIKSNAFILRMIV